jgi:hypothetical protein
MKPRNFAGAILFVFLALVCSPAFAGDHDDHDRGRGHHDRDHKGEHYVYSDHDRDNMRGWYEDHSRHLPPGLARRDRLPPGLERQLVVRGRLTRELRGRIRPCPQDFERRLPPPPRDCEHVLIGGHIVLLNRVNFQIVDVFHLEF